MHFALGNKIWVALGKIPAISLTREPKSAKRINKIYTMDTNRSPLLASNLHSKIMTKLKKGVGMEDRTFMTGWSSKPKQGWKTDRQTVKPFTL